MTREEKELALYCLKASSDYHSEVCEECIKYPNCDHTGQDDVTETIIKALEQEPCSDAISRQAALKLFFSDDTEYTGSEICNMIHGLPSVHAEPTRWIPVSERLPNIGQRVLVTTETLDNGKTVTGTYYDRYGFVCGNVIAWMPLPKAYEPQESEV